MIPVQVRSKMIKLIIALVLAISFLGSSGHFLPNRWVSLSQPQSAGNPTVRVWVNTNSGVYHCPGTRWYGNTKEGQFMSQREAQAKRYRPALWNSLRLSVKRIYGRKISQFIGQRYGYQYTL